MRDKRPAAYPAFARELCAKSSLSVGCLLDITMFNRRHSGIQYPVDCLLLAFCTSAAWEV